MIDKRITVMFPVNQLGVGGAEQQLLELVRGMDKQRFAPIVVSLYPGGVLEPEVKALTGVEYICLFRKGPYDYSILYDIHRLLKQRKIQIIQPFLTPATFFGILPALMNRGVIKIITERCGVRVNLRFGAAIYRKAEDLFTRYADWVIPNSQAGEKYLIRRGIKPDRIKVIYNGINLQRLVPKQEVLVQARETMGLPPDGKVVGITASLTQAKDHETFLQAAKIISEALPRTRFAILGDGPLKPALMELSRQLGLESAVTFFGNQRDIGSYLSVYDVACLTSADHEGCSNATLEAMALGKPAVITDIGGNKEIVKHGQTGFLVPPKGVKAIAETVIKLLTQPELSGRIGENARQMIYAQFSLEAMVRNYEVLYENVLQQKQEKGNKEGLTGSVRLIPDSNNS